MDNENILVTLEISNSNTGEIVYSVVDVDIMYCVGRVAHYFKIDIMKAIKAVDAREFYGYGSNYNISIKENK